MFLDYKIAITYKNNICSYIQSDYLLILTETSTKLFKSAWFLHLASMLDKAVPPSTYASTLDDASKIQLFQMLDELCFEGVICNASSPIKHTIVDTQKDELGDNVLYLSDIFQLATTEISSPKQLVSYIEGKRILGPLISNDAEKEQLVHRILASDPIRTWFENKFAIKTKRPVISQALSEACLNTLYSVTSSQYFFHDTPYQLYRDEPELWPRPLHIVDNGDCKTQDGGLRQQPASTTLSRLTKYLGSPLSVVNSIREISRDNGLNYKTYRASFNKTIRKDEEPTVSSYEIAALGKGKTEEQAKMSAIGECFERYAAFYQGNEQSFIAPYSAIADKAFRPEELNSLSHQQKQNYKTINYPSKSSDSRYNNFTTQEHSHWYPGISLTSNTVKYFPLNYVFADAPHGFNYSSWTSNGCAAGQTIEEAALQGIFEVVERDAIAIWWYNKLVLPNVDLNTVDKGVIAALNSDLGLDWQCQLLDATHDIDIPVYIAIARNAKTHECIFGFGCHLSPNIAIERAISEMCQVLDVKDKHSAMFDFKSLENEAFLNGCHHQPKKLPKSRSLSNIKQCLEDCLNKLSACDLDTFIIDYNRPEIPLKCVKVIIPGTNHMWPQFANERLYSVPVKQGLLQEKSAEYELNQIPLYL
ncbi:hypothetical protein N473_13700 [Pseudoalteromonas luteoviolacea CPMOR-1]|uniref:YcaO domain-containing protein n=1 Tax=Pseudoalteromonas luteoviolacea CPMOR-1 TaxID=1365248 RepID=A0A161Z8A6_9GAMM|nr:YcaO-like family protein [Pseudoalteromonas luteoviolacea]KZN64843.1 hypothetical protein N473_13700 [Pseudoalteromonas luteoviolacea CPMOR-1]